VRAVAAIIDPVPIVDVCAACEVSLRHGYRMVANGVFGDQIGKLPDNSLAVERSAVEKHLGHPIEPKPRRGRGRPYRGA
jgi:hypothetical protein